MHITINNPSITSIQIDEDDILNAAVSDLDPDDILSSLREDDIQEYCRVNFDPDDVFDEDALAKWAEDNGFVKDDE